MRSAEDKKEILMTISKAQSELKLQYQELLRVRHSREVKWKENISQGRNKQAATHISCQHIEQIKWQETS